MDNCRIVSRAGKQVDLIENDGSIPKRVRIDRVYFGIYNGL